MKAAQALAMIERNATIEAKLVKDLLDVSSILSSKLRLKPQPIDLRALIQTVVLTFGGAAQAKRIQLLETISDEVQEHVLADGDRVKQVIANLLENAIKFTPEGGRVAVELAMDSGEVEERRSRGVKERGSEGVNDSLPTPLPLPPIPSLIQITVSDTGIGIRLDLLPFTTHLTQI